MRTWAPSSPVSVLPPPAATITTSTAGPLAKFGWAPSSRSLPLAPVPLPVPTNVPPPARYTQPTGGPISAPAPAPPRTALPAPAFAPPPPLPANLSQMLLDELAGLGPEPTAPSAGWLEQEPQEQLAELALMEEQAVFLWFQNICGSSI